MSRISSTYGKQANEKFVKSASKMYGGNYLTDAQRSLSLSGENLKTQPTKSGRSPKSSGTFTEAVQASTSALEQEYIKSLQQQVYLLELENNHLRSQAVKATDLHPTMAAEAERMLRELKTLQAKVDALQLENFRKEGAAEVLQQKVNGLTSKLAQYEQSHQEERSKFDKDSSSLRHERDMHQRDAGRLQLRLSELQDDYERKLTDIKSAEVKLGQLRGQLESALDRLSAAETALTDERSNSARLEARVKVLELELANSNPKSLERSIRELRDENLALKERLRNEQGRHNQESLLRAKSTEETSALVKQNASLEQQVAELERLLANERNKSTQWAAHVESESDELTRLRERERTLEYQVSRSIDEVAQLRLRNERLGEQLAQAESMQNSGGLELTVARRRIDELEGYQAELTRQIERLQKDKSELIQHIDELQREIKSRDAEKEGAQASLERTEQRLTEMQAEVARLQRLQATRWSEVEKMADTLRSAAHSNSVLFDKY